MVFADALNERRVYATKWECFVVWCVVTVWRQMVYADTHSVRREEGVLLGKNNFANYGKLRLVECTKIKYCILTTLSVKFVQLEENVCSDGLWDDAHLLLPPFCYLIQTTAK